MIDTPKTDALEAECLYRAGEPDWNKAMELCRELERASRPEGGTLDEPRLRAIIRQAIWDLEVQRPDMALIALRYAGVEEAPLPQGERS